MKVMHVVGARPNFMKVAPVRLALALQPGISQVLVHTGQHYDANMSQVFFGELALPEPDINLGVGADSHARQTARIMIDIEPVLKETKPDLVLVYGDVNSTLAAALVCAKLGTPVGHVEAGLRSFDRTMPEEINRILTDQVSDLLFTPCLGSRDNLLREGVSAEKIHPVGNVMIDTLVRLLPEALERWDHCRARFGLNGAFGLVTLHRPSNVDKPDMLLAILATLNDISRDLPLLFPLHPRTCQSLKQLPWQPTSSGLCLLEPLGYLDFLALTAHALVVVTDSGGIQEETTFLGVPCITVRPNTERPVTITQGTNRLVGQDMARLRQEVEAILVGETDSGKIPDLWDGKAGERIASVLTRDWGRNQV